MPNTFKAFERLKSRKAIEQLLVKGMSFYFYPVRILYSIEQAKRSEPLQVAFSVSKKKFKRAVDRNLLKRRMRESWRLNKENLRKALVENNRQADVLLIYSSKSIEPYQLINEKILLVLNRLIVETQQETKNESNEK
ncbi:MAG TPA: ribonuclease P protein component [Salinivirgaceae bacterium]|nr:ribonuclease P protein component [Salinivirgaceae bacterium]